MSELSYVEEKEQWQEQINQLKKQHEFSVSICQTLMQDQQVDMKSSYFALFFCSYLPFNLFLTPSSNSFWFCNLVTVTYFLSTDPLLPSTDFAYRTLQYDAQ